MEWISLAFAALIALSSYNFVLKLTAPKISSLYALPFIALGVFIVSLAGLVFSRNVSDLNFSKQGLMMSVATGALWGLGQIFFFWMFAKGAPFSVGLPFIVGGLAIIGSILGVFVLKEPFSVLKVLGVFLILTGLILLAKA